VDTYEKKKATLVSEMHFKDRDGKQLDNVSASRYSCTQCHVEQRVAEPLNIHAYRQYLTKGSIKKAAVKNLI
jgi:cytochrome c-type protein NapB